MRIEGAAPPASSSSGVRDVAARRTPTSLTEIRSALSRALQAATGRDASATTVDVLAAQVSLETARGTQMYNFNFGGIKGASPEGQTATYMTREVLGGQEVHMQQGFRAYASLDHGARDYVSLMRARFPNAFARAAVGDVAGFAHALKQSRYYTASEADYASGLRAAGAPASAAPSIESLDSASGEFSTSAALSRVLDALAASAARIAEPDSDG
jgi:flagellum-specific peptidoglycan hydrolase FlgJ